jgi:hypothetical protein
MNSSVAFICVSSNSALDQGKLCYLASGIAEICNIYYLLRTHTLAKIILLLMRTNTEIIKK